MALGMIIIAILVAIFGYRLYAVKIDREIIQADPKRATPATMYNDGVDFMPAKGSVLFGYQFKSIAALGPIVGPITAVQWGWLPSILWLLFGVLLIGWVQDYAAAMLAMRSDGLTLGGLSYKLISPRARNLLLGFLYFYLLLIMGAFGAVVAGLLATPTVPIGFIILTLAGLLAGQMTYRWRMDLLTTTVVTVLIALVGIWLGTLAFSTNIVKVVNSLAGDANGVLYNTPYGPMQWSVWLWGIFALFFCYLGSVLPIWRFAQPVNYTSFWFVALGIIGAILGILIATFTGSVGTSFQIPAYVTWNQPALGWLWPILFVTISCGAVSGWHSLVSTSGTARQLEKETDALPVGAGAMFLEVVLAVLAVVFAATLIVAPDGSVLYDAANLYQLKIGAGGVFAAGMARFLAVIGIPSALGGAIGAIFLAVMALTVMQLVLRFMRVASAELLGDALPIMKNPHIGSIVALGFTMLILWTAFWQRIWVLFGGANQLFAGLALLLITIWLAEQGKKYAWTFWPAVFMYVTTVAALLVTAYKSFFDAKGLFDPTAGLAFQIGNGIAGLIGLFLAIAALFLAWDGIISFNRARSKAAAAPAASE
ncbi:MAG: carbon starvation protein A [Anaerolineae bacterium]|nr:carbon starvation protein A [Anaerolineae bacterium]